MAAVNGGEMYFYALPPGLVDQRLQPNFAVSNDVAVLTLSREHSERLLKSTPPTDEFLRRHADQRISAAFALNVPGTLDFLKSWLEFGLQGAGKQAGDPMVRELGQVLDIFKVIRGYSSVTYFEGGAEVEHTEIVVQNE
jgi:hypothetical protein